MAGRTETLVSNSDKARFIGDNWPLIVGREGEGRRRQILELLVRDLDEEEKTRAFLFDRSGHVSIKVTKLPQGALDHIYQIICRTLESLNHPARE